MPNIPNPEEERRSYAGTFALCAGALLAVAIWCLVDDLFSRRPWKKYQAELSWQEIEKAEQAIAEGESKLQGDESYLELLAKRDALRARLDSGDLADDRRELLAALGKVGVRLAEADQELRFVKSEIEEARYEFDHTLHQHGDLDPVRARIEALDEHKSHAEEELEAAKAAQEKIQQQLDALGSELSDVESQIEERRAEIDEDHRKLDGLTALNLTLPVPLVGNVSLRTPPVPNIKQVVLEEFDRSRFDTPLARVDRCESCHAAINKAGYEDGENPLKTHPDRMLYFASHPPEKFGCTPCHGGQGAALNSPETAHGEVMFWEHPLLRGEKVQSSCVSCHLNVRGLHGADTIAHGEKLFEQLGCHGCHLVEGYDGLAKAGPSLRRIAAKADHGWLVEWITNPQGYRPRTRMPNFGFEREQAVSIAAFLLKASADPSADWTSDNGPPVGVSPTDAATVARGKELVDSLGCRGCHAFEKGEVAGTLGENKDIAPNLSNVAQKADARWVYHWIRNPRGYSHVARMPNLRLSEAEARSITSFLMTRGTRARPNPALEQQLRDEKRVQAGEKLVRKYGCPGCHDIPGMESESRIGVELSTFSDKTLEELFFGDRMDVPRTWDDWTYNKLKEPRTYATHWIEQLMPNFQLEDADIRALMKFLGSRTEAKVPAKFRVQDDGRSERIVTGRRVVQRYNCTGCHVINNLGGDILRHYEGREALGPPRLNGEGAKVQAPWLFDFLKRPIPIRPWLEVRMPTFGFTDDEANNLVSYFAALDEVERPFVYVDQEGIPREHVEAGRLLFSEDYFNCWSCHQQGARKPEGPPDGWAPDLAMAHERLNPAWMIRWITDPQTVMPGTKMPSFYPDGPPDVLGGSDERQIRALRDYILTFGNGRVAMR